MFDLGGVVFDIDFERAFSHWATFAGVPVETLKSRYRIDAWYEQHERGEIEAAEYFDALRDTLGITIPDELFQSLGSRIPIYAFSNSNVTHQEFWERKYAKTLGLFRQVFVSCELGLRKPEAAAFRHVAACIGTEPENLLFFDDRAENVDGARDIGMSAVQVRGFAEVRVSVTEFLE